jgi:hypothetical protein
MISAVRMALILLSDLFSVPTNISSSVPSLYPHCNPIGLMPGLLALCPSVTSSACPWFEPPWADSFPILKDIHTPLYWIIVSVCLVHGGDLVEHILGKFLD